MHPRLEVYYSRHDLIIASPLRQSIRKSYSNFHGRVGKTNKTFKVQCFSHKHVGGVKYGARGILSPQYVTTEVGYPSRAVQLAQSICQMPSFNLTDDKHRGSEWDAAARCVNWLSIWLGCRQRITEGFVHALSSHPSGNIVFIMNAANWMRQNRAIFKAARFRNRYINGHVLHSLIGVSIHCGNLRLKDQFPCRYCAGVIKGNPAPE